MKRSRTATLAHLSVLLAALGMTACTSTQDVLEPAALLSNETSGSRQAEFPLAAPSPTGTANPSEAPTVAIVTDAKVRFAPVVGAPAAASTPLAARLSTRAGQRGISLSGPDDGSATHVMKGYFSAITEAGETTVIYVWDVMDPAGTRVHRIQGQARAPSDRAEGWDGVQSSTMEAIADQTVDQLAAWLSTGQG